LKRHFHMLAPADLGRPMLNDASRPSALVTFDDGFLEQYTHAFPILQDEGVRAWFFLPTAFLGARCRPPWADPPYSTSEFLTVSHARDLLAHGHAIGSHTCTHKALNLLDLSALRSEL